MKIWSTIFLFLAAAIAAAQFNAPLTAEQRAEAERVFREFSGAPAGTKLTLGTRRGRQVEVRSDKESATVDLFAGEVADWKPNELGEADDVSEREAIDQAQRFMNAKKFELEGKPTAERVEGAWVVAFPKPINGYESPLRDRVTIRRKGQIDGLEREILLGRPRVSEVDVQPEQAVNVARNKFASKYGDVKTVRFLKTAYAFAGPGELGDNPDNVMGGRRLRLAHIVELTAPGRKATIAVDTVDAEIIMDEIVAEEAAPLPVAEAAEESKKRDDSKRIMIAIIFAIGCLGGTLYWFGRMRRAQSSPVDDEDL